MAFIPPTNFNFERLAALAANRPWPYYNVQLLLPLEPDPDDIVHAAQMEALRRSRERLVAAGKLPPRPKPTLHDLLCWVSQSRREREMLARYDKLRKLLRGVHEERNPPPPSNDNRPPRRPPPAPDPALLWTEKVLKLIRELQEERRSKENKPALERAAAGFDRLEGSGQLQEQEPRASSSVRHFTKTMNPGTGHHPRVLSLELSVLLSDQYLAYPGPPYTDHSPISNSGRWGTLHAWVGDPGWAFWGLSVAVAEAAPIVGTSSPDAIDVPA
jgi:hypothetical protein